MTFLLHALFDYFSPRDGSTGQLFTSHPRVSWTLFAVLYGGFAYPTHAFASSYTRPFRYHPLLVPPFLSHVSPRWIGDTTDGRFHFEFLFSESASCTISFSLFHTDVALAACGGMNGMPDGFFHITCLLYSCACGLRRDEGHARWIFSCYVLNLLMRLRQITLYTMK